MMIRNGVFDQEIKTSSSPQFTKLGLGHAAGTDILEIEAGTTGLGATIQSSTDNVALSLDATTGKLPLLRYLINSDVKWFTYCDAGNFYIQDSDGNRLLVDHGTGNVRIGYDGTNGGDYSLEVFETAGDRVARFRQLTTETTGLRQIIYNVARSSGDMTDGFGSTVEFGLMDDAAVYNSIGYLGYQREGADNSGKFVLYNTNAGTPALTLSITKDGQLQLEGGGAFLKERSAAAADVAAYGQLWIKDDTPNVPKFTDDAGTDFNLAISDGDTGGAGSAGAGNQYVELNIGGTTYKVLHDGTV